MKKRKHQFHCQDCGLPCEIYRHGKNHRVLVCPQCGVLATNPGKFGSILKTIGSVTKQAKGTQILESQFKKHQPEAYGKVTGLIGSQLGIDTNQGAMGSSSYPSSPKQTIIHKSERDYLFTPEEKVNLALK